MAVFGGLDFSINSAHLQCKLPNLRLRVLPALFLAPRRGLGRAEVRGEAPSRLRTRPGQPPDSTFGWAGGAGPAESASIATRCGSGFAREHKMTKSSQCSRVEHETHRGAMLREQRGVAYKGAERASWRDEVPERCEWSELISYAIWRGEAPLWSFSSTDTVNRSRSDRTFD